MRLASREGAETFWTTWNEAFPDNRLQTTAIHADDRGGVYEGRGIGTHTGTLRGPSGEIAATGRAATCPSPASTNSTKARSPATTCTSTRRS